MFNRKLKRGHVHEHKIGENDPLTPQAANRHVATEMTYSNGLPKQSRITVLNNIMSRIPSVEMPLWILLYYLYNVRRLGSRVSAKRSEPPSH